MEQKSGRDLSSNTDFLWVRREKMGFKKREICKRKER